MPKVFAKEPAKKLLIAFVPAKQRPLMLITRPRLEFAITDCKSIISVDVKLDTPSPAKNIKIIVKVTLLKLPTKMYARQTVVHPANKMRRIQLTVVFVASSKDASKEPTPTAPKIKPRVSGLPFSTLLT